MARSVVPPSPSYRMKFASVSEPPRAEAGLPAPPSDAVNTEWLLTNGLGGFAMGTAAGVNTRRYHSLFTVSQRPPVQRVNLLNNVADAVTFSGQTYELATFEFAGSDGRVFHPRGFAYLRAFERDSGGAAVRWTFEVGPLRIVRELRMGWQIDAAELSYRIEPLAASKNVPRETTLTVRPLVALRDFHHQRRSGGFDPFHISKTAEAAVIISTDSLPPLHLTGEGGTFIEDGQWWYGFRRAREADRGQDHLEDLYSPGRFEQVLAPRAKGGGEWRLTLSTAQFASPRSLSEPRSFSEPPRVEAVGPGSSQTARSPRALREKPPRHAAALKDEHADVLGSDARQALVRRAASHMAGRKRDKQTTALLTKLAAASIDFVVPRTVDGKPMTTILAGYPWFADWGRDTMISLPGLLLCTGRFDEAKQTLTTYARHIRGGLVPNRFDDYGGEPHYNTVDASLWFIHAAIEYVRLSGDKATWNQTLSEACRQIITAYQRGTDGPVSMDSDGLIVAGNRATQLTWMDAARDGHVFTPRHGKAVEINALWHRALTGCAAAMSSPGGDKLTADMCRKLAAKVKRSFNKTFWHEGFGHLVDHVQSDGHVDASLRPNQVLAVSLAESPLSPARQKRIMQQIRERLLTPLGLRTLPVDDPNYHGRYAGSMFERDRAYHQGTVWPWLIGPYVEGWLRAHDFSDLARQHGREALRPLHEELHRHSLGSIPEIYWGDAPHHPEGCIAQAWSVAETLRATLLVESTRGDL